MSETILVTVIATTDGGSCCVDLAVADDVELETLLPELLDACGLPATDGWTTLDGGRELRIPGPGLAAQGVVSGSVLRLERRRPGS